MNDTNGIYDDWFILDESWNAFVSNLQIYISMHSMSRYAASYDLLLLTISKLSRKSVRRLFSPVTSSKTLTAEGGVLSIDTDSPSVNSSSNLGSEVVSPYTCTM